MKRFEGEYNAFRDAAVLADVGHWGKLRFEGPDRKKFLQGLLTNDVLRLEPGGSLHSCVLTPKGKLLGDFELFDRGEDLLAVGEASAVENLRKAVAPKLVLSQTKMTDLGSTLGLLFLAGPRAGEARLLQEPCRFELLPFERLAWNGCLLVTAAHEKAGVQRALIELGFTRADREFLDVLRVEKGVPAFGVDMDPDSIPLEARLDDAISGTKGCYMGQETICRIKNLGHVNRLLVGLKIDGAEPPSLPAAALSGGQEIGWVTSAAWLPRVKAVGGLATVRSEHAHAGARLEVADRGRARAAEVVSIS